MTDIFLSYSREDQIVARRFAGGFEREGLSVWWDQSLTPGEAFDQVTERALGEARAVIVLWSRSSVNSRWVRAEATQANADHRLVPVMIEHCKRPIMFELTHTADLSDWQGNADDPAWQSFLASVRQFVQHSVSESPADTGAVAARLVKPSAFAQALTGIKRIRFARIGTAVLFALVGAAIAGAIVWNVRPRGDHEITRFAVDLAAPLSNEATLAISPDGRRIVYAVGRQLFTRRLDQEVPTLIPGANEAQDPFFSPDGKSVAFFTPKQLKAFDFENESLRVIADIKSAAGLAGTWGEDGRIYFGQSGPFGISWVPAVGGEPEIFTPLAKYADLDYPEELPGAEWVLYTANISSGDWSGSDIVAQNVVSGERKIVLKGGHFARYIPGHLLFARGGTLYAVAFDAKRVATRGRAVPVVQGITSSEVSGHAGYAVAANGTLSYVSAGLGGARITMNAVVQVSRSGESSRLSPDLRAYKNPRVSPDGSRIATEVAGVGTGAHIWIMDAGTGAASQLTFEGDEDRFPVWSSDGREIFFTSRRGKELSIYRKAADGTGESRHVVSGGSSLAPTDIRGHTLIFQDRVEGHARDVMSLDLDAQGPPHPLIATLDDDSGARVAPGGAWIAYTSVSVSNPGAGPKIFVRPFPNAAGGQRGLSEHSGINAVWSPVGDEIYYIELRDGPIGLVSIPVAVTPTTISPMGRNELFEFFPRFDISTVGTASASSYDVSPKGRIIAVETSPLKTPEGAEGAAKRPGINVVLNWAEDLRRLAPAE